MNPPALRSDVPLEIDSALYVIEIVSPFIDVSLQNPTFFELCLKVVMMLVCFRQKKGSIDKKQT